MLSMWWNIIIHCKGYRAHMDHMDFDVFWPREAVNTLNWSVSQSVARSLTHTHTHTHTHSHTHTHTHTLTLTPTTHSLPPSSLTHSPTHARTRSLTPLEYKGCYGVSPFLKCSDMIGANCRWFFKWVQVGEELKNFYYHLHWLPSHMLHKPTQKETAYMVEYGKIEMQAKISTLRHKYFYTISFGSN